MDINFIQEPSHAKMCGNSITLNFIIQSLYFLALYLCESIPTSGNIMQPDINLKRPN